MIAALQLERYAMLLAKVGLAVQPGQRVALAGEVCHRELLMQTAAACYELGARHVVIDLIEPRLDRVRIERSDERFLEYVPAEVGVRYDDILASRGASLRVVGLEDPLLYEGLDAGRLNVTRIARYRAIQRFYQEGISNSLVHWTVAAAPTPGWAARVYPELDPGLQVDTFWRDLLSICRVDGTGFVEEWRDHSARLEGRARALTALGIKMLHFSGPGTELDVGLDARAVFKGGAESGPRGVPFQPNIPTEECFTTPNWRLTNGTARATRPVHINGQLVSGLVLVFKDGELTEFTADTNREVFSEYIQSDSGARRVGEVALVGIDSPIFRAGRVFEEILLDENAACHIALGSAYKFCLRDGSRLSPEELSAVGCNESSVHTDIMISSEEVDVAATLYSGKRVDLLVKGQWQTF